MPKGGAGRHWRPTRSPGKDAARCATGDGLTATRNVATVPLCRRHVGACRQALGTTPTSEQVRTWVRGLAPADHGPDVLVADKAAGDHGEPAGTTAPTPEDAAPVTSAG